MSSLRPETTTSRSRIAGIVGAADRRLATELEAWEGPLVSAFAGPKAMGVERVLNALRGDRDDPDVRPVYVGTGLTPAVELRTRWGAELVRRGRTVPAEASWSELVQVAAAPPRVPTVFGGADRVAAMDRRFLEELASGCRSAAAKGNVARIVLVSDDRRFLAGLLGEHSPFHDPLAALTSKNPDAVLQVEMGALSYDTLGRLCDAWSPIDVLRGASVFGGKPGIIRWIEPRRDLAWNVTQLLLDPDGPLFDRPGLEVAARFQKTSRYGSILSGLGHGSASWRQLAQSSPSFGSGSPLGPYLKRLVDRGFVEVHESLDAGRGSRRKRYRLADPVDAFWFRLIAPLRDRLLARQLGPLDAWEEYVAPALDAVAAGGLPRIACDFLRHGAGALLGSPARAVGGLWGEGYDFDAAATLQDGSVAYGHCTWDDRRIGTGALERTRSEMRETRYGFGRQRRTILLFMKRPPGTDLEHASLREPDVEWLDAARLVESARESS